jgi:hypothetical protein
MAHHPDIHVIVVERVRRGTVDERRLAWSGTPAAPDESSTVAPALGSYLFGKYRGEGLARALYGYGYPVQDAMLGDRDDVGRKILVSESRDAMRQRLGQALRDVRTT